MIDSLVTLDIPVPMPSGIVMRLVRSWDPVANQWRQRMGRLCECGQMIPYFVQIDPWIPNELEEPDYDGYGW